MIDISTTLSFVSVMAVPLCPGYIGTGMLSAAVAGGVFASPPPTSILAAILHLHNAGTAHVCVCVFVCLCAGVCVWFGCVFVEKLYVV